MQPHEINGHHVGLVMREACKRAMQHATDRCFEVEAEVKGKKADGRSDWVTAADRECETIVVGMLREQFPHYGIISEESDLTVPCSIVGEDIYFTVDPIDGTSAYTRKQSHGWGCMISLVRAGEVIAVCIGDANSGEMYYFRPGSDKTHRLLRRGDHVKEVSLPQLQHRPLFEQAVLLRDLPKDHGLQTQVVIKSPHWAKILIADGSIGLSMARLWKGEVGACILKGRKKTPWDDTPVIGMTLRLGFIFLQIELEENAGTMCRLRQMMPKPPRVEGPQPYSFLVIHKDQLPSVRKFCHDFSFSLEA